MLEIKKSKDTIESARVNMLCYGMPGTGKTTFAGKGVGKVIVADCESGSTMLGVNGIDCDVATIKTWEDMEEFYGLVQKGGYDTVVIDPIGELLDKLIQHLRKNGYSSGKGDSMTLQGWGVAKEKFRGMMRAFRDSKVHFIAVAHTAESKDEDQLLTRPKLQAKLDEDVCAMMDVVGYLKIGKVDKTNIRRLFLEPSDRYYAKDRTGLLPEYIDNPTFSGMVDIIEKNPLFQKAKEMTVKREKSMEDFTKDIKLN